MANVELPTEDSLELLFSRHAPPGGRRQLSEQGISRLRASGSTEVEVTVVVGDLRLSGFVLKEAIRPALFARFVIGFTEAVRGLTHANDGWFDKFTGDGFISFWIHPDDGDGAASAVPEFCQAVLPASATLIDNLRANSRNFPVGVGLSLGADRGTCELARVGESLTLIGGPIVGASRMVAGARANRLVANVGLGRSLEGAKTNLESRGISVRRTEIRTKEYPSGQEAYELSFSAVPSRRRRHRAT